jgi:primosomal protein N' (replication factor Y) (superfamily II helicase)
MSVLAPPQRWVEVAVDAAGPTGGQTYTYHLPVELADVVPGEAVLVEYGRRTALGIVFEIVPGRPERETKPVIARVRSDGPLLPLLQLQLARYVADHYLAPVALVIRAMLAPGALERVERLTVAGPDGPRSEWRIRPAESRPRVDRFVALAPQAAGGQLGERRGPRQQALIDELRLAAEPVRAADLAARHGQSAVRGLLRRGVLSLETREVARRPLADRAAPQRGALPAGAELSGAQQAVIDLVGAATAGRAYRGILLEGATAAGKTAVYAASIAAALASGRGAIVLVPEIALAVPLLERLAHDLGVEVAVLHSSLSDGERADEWRRIRSGEVRVVVGTRMAVLAPMADPGVVIVDEEHDAAYKSDRTPRYQARDLALELGRLAGAPVLLGSATPDVVTLGRARAGELQHVVMAERMAGLAAQVDVVDLRAELAAGNRGLLSNRLVEALAVLDRSAGERAILIINRRGSASVVMCRDCGYVQICPECQRPLVFHASVLALRCHHCGATAPVARRCPACDSPRIRYLGGGTERVEREVLLRFPEFRVARLDRDVVERKGAAVRVIDDFAGGRLDVLVGTALAAKGLDVPEVTLVGVVSADIALNLPDERASERTYQLLAQAVGRAGRGIRPGRALIQTYQPDHPAIRAVADGSAAAFYDAELAVRQRYRSPPFGRLIKLTVALEDRVKAETQGREFVGRLRARATELGVDVEVLGPAPAYIARRAGKWRFHVVLRGDDPLAVLGGDPGSPWSVDVDPESLL